MFLTFLFYLLLGYLAFQFIFRFLLPLIRTTRQVRRGFREMNQRMNEQFGGDGAPGNAAQKVQPGGRPTAKGDYIDFEEIKE